MDLVHELAVCRWRIQRCWTMESNMFDITVGRNKSAVECEFKACSRDMQFTLAFMKMADEGRAMSLLHRYETRLTRRYNQVMRDLDRLQSKPPREDDDHVTPETLPTARPQNCQSNSETAPAASSKIPSDGQKRPSIYLPPGIRRFHSRDPRTGKACDYVDLPVDPITGALRT